MLAQGVSLRVVMEVLGHSEIGTTANIYGHIMPELTSDATAPLAHCRLWTRSNTGVLSGGAREQAESLRHTSRWVLPTRVMDRDQLSSRSLWQANPSNDKLIDF